MAKSHCMSQHAARECSRGRAKKMATELDETIKLLMWSKEKLFLSFPWLTCETFHVLLWGWGWGKLTLVWYVELTSQTAGEEVIFFIAEPLVQAQGRQEDLGRQPRFSSSQSQKKLCHSWEQLAWLLRQAEVAPKRAAKALFGSGNRSHIPTEFVVHRTPMKWKSSALSNHKQLARTGVREVESNATLTKNAIVHLFVWEQLLSKAKSCLSVDRPSRTAIAIDVDSVGPPSPLSLVTDFFWHRLGLFSCWPTLIVNEIRFLWTQAFGQGQKARRSRRKKRCSVLVSSRDPVLSRSIFCLSPFACKRFWKAWELRGLIPQQNGLQGWTTQDA